MAFPVGPVRATNGMSLVTITDTTIRGNSAMSSGGGLEDNSGGSASNNGGILSITDSTIRGNSAGLGGGLHSYGGLVTVARSTICDNSVTVDGGGLYGVGKVGSLVTITDSSVRMRKRWWTTWKSWPVVRKAR